MKKMKFWKRAILLVFCMMTVIFLSACMTDMPVGDNGQLAGQFMNFVVTDDYNGAYGMLKNVASEEAFAEYWQTIRTVADGAETFFMKQIGWNINSTNGIITCTTAHQVEFDNGRTILFRVVTREDIPGLANVYFHDTTDFVTGTAYVSVVSIVLTVLSLLAIAFTVWMFVDCLRRKVKLKALWAIVTLLGIAVTFTYGQTLGIHFSLGLIFQISSIVAEPAILSVKLKLAVPLGAIVYFFLRKRLTVVSAPVEETVLAVEPPIGNTATEVEALPTNDTAE